MDPSERDKLFDRILMENARLIHSMAWRHAGAALARDLEQEILLALWHIGKTSCLLLSLSSGRAPLRAIPSVSDKMQYVN